MSKADVEALKKAINNISLLREHYYVLLDLYEKANEESKRFDNTVLIESDTLQPIKDKIEALCLSYAVLHRIKSEKERESEKQWNGIGKDR